MMRRSNEEYMAQQTSPISRQPEGLESRRLVYRGRASRGETSRIRGLKKCHTIPNSSYDLLISAKGPVSMNTTNEIGIMPIIGENEDFSLTAVSRWQSLPSLESGDEGDSNSRPQSPVQLTKKRINGPKPPRRQKSMESIRGESN